MAQTLHLCQHTSLSPVICLSTILCIEVVRLREENARLKEVVEELSKSSVSCGHNIIDPFC